MNLSATGRKTGFHFCWSRSLRLSPPKRLLSLVSDVAPRKSDVMQVAIGPMGQFMPLLPAVTPDMQRINEPRQKPQFMMIYHRSG
jgi:hypothetical protein